MRFRLTDMFIICLLFVFSFLVLGVNESEAACGRGGASVRRTNRSTTAHVGAFNLLFHRNR